MKLPSILYCLFFSCLISHTTIAQNTFVTSIHALEIASEAAEAGSVITLADGIYLDTVFNIQNDGSANAPIRIQAENPGGVIFKGRTKLRVGGSHLIFDGFSFDSLTWRESDKGLIVFKLGDTTNACHNCVITNFKFQDRELTTDTVRSFVWVSTHGRFNEICHSSFENKQTRGVCVRVNRTKTLVGAPDQHKIHHNFFAGRRAVRNAKGSPFNGQEALVIGGSTDPSLDAQCEVYNNLVYDWLSEAEVFSSKSSGNRFYRNTFRDYMGTLSLRKGNDGEVFQNFFLATGDSISGGIRLYGKNHRIHHNYIENTYNRSSDFHGGINIGKGEPTFTGSSYDTVDNLQVVFNTFVNCDKSILLGTKPSTDATIAPKGVLIANNIFADGPNELVLLDAMTQVVFLANTIEGDSCIAGCTNFNVKTDTDLLNSGYSRGIRRISANSIAKDAAMGDFSDLNQDILGALLPITPEEKDRGAEERDGENLYNQAYDNIPNHVGRRIGFGSDFRFRCYTTSNLSYFNHPEGSYQASRFIRSIALILPNQSVQYEVGDSLILRVGFHAYQGSSFTAKVATCAPPPNFVQMNSISDELEIRNKRKSSFQVFPNPVNNQIFIALNFKTSTMAQIDLFDSMGTHLLAMLPKSRQEGIQTLSFDISNLPNGIYWVQLKTNDEQEIRPIVIVE